LKNAISILSIKEKQLIYRNCEGNMLLFPLESDTEINSSFKRYGKENLFFSLDQRDFKI